jgi:hypothetical protein
MRFVSTTDEKIGQKRLKMNAQKKNTKGLMTQKINFSILFDLVIK